MRESLYYLLLNPVKINGYNANDLIKKFQKETEIARQLNIKLEELSADDKSIATDGQINALKCTTIDNLITDADVADEASHWVEEHQDLLAKYDFQAPTYID